MQSLIQRQTHQALAAAVDTFGAVLETHRWVPSSALAARSRRTTDDRSADGTAAGDRRLLQFSANKCCHCPFEDMIEDLPFHMTFISSHIARRSGSPDVHHQKLTMPLPAGATPSGEDDAAPPYVLMEAPPLAVFVNGVLAALNELRHCAPLALRDLFAARLQVWAGVLGLSCWHSGVTGTGGHAVRLR